MKKLILIVPMFVFSYCRESSANRIDLELLGSERDFFLIDIPRQLQTNELAKNWKFYKDSSLGLARLDNSNKNVELRVSLDHENRFGFLLTLKHNLSKWTADLYEYDYYSQEEYTFDSIIFKGAKKLNDPKSGWDHLLNKLLALQILTLPDYSTIPGYEVNTDESMITVEIGKKDQYRYYRYPDPFRKKQKFSQAKNIVDILNILNAEFSLNLKISN